MEKSICQKTKETKSCIIALFYIYTTPLGHRCALMFVHTEEITEGKRTVSSRAYQSPHAIIASSFKRFFETTTKTSISPFASQVQIHQSVRPPLFFFLNYILLNASNSNGLCTHWNRGKRSDRVAYHERRSMSMQQHPINCFGSIKILWHQKHKQSAAHKYKDEHKIRTTEKILKK